MLAQLSQDDDVRLVAVRGGIGAVPGVRSAGVHAGIKLRKRDLAVIAFDQPQVCASVITTNEIKAAPSQRVGECTYEQVELAGGNGRRVRNVGRPA